VAYLIVDDFKAGLDQRKSIITAPPGALYAADNVHITRGGEIQKRMAFVPYGTVPDNSKGLVSAVGILYVYGPTPPTVAMPANVKFTQITHPTGANLVRIIASTLFLGIPYVLAAYDDGSVLHFYNGAMIPDWYVGGALATYVAVDVITLGTKVYVAANSSVIFSANNDATQWSLGVGGLQNGFGIIDMSTNYAGFDTLTAVNVYINRLAVYSQHAIQIWIVDPDPELYQLVQTIPNQGTLAPNSVSPYGDSDNFMLAMTGIRSIRARDMSNIAGAYDIGTPIDDLVNPQVRSLTTPVNQAQAVLDPIDGRYILSVGPVIYVFSYFLTSRISAWTTYSIGAPVDAFAVSGPQLYARVGNQILLYGGANYATWDDSVATVVMPYLDAGTPATVKSVAAIQAAITGTWDIQLGMLPQPPYAKEDIGTFTAATFGLGRVDLDGEGTHFGLAFTSSAPIECKIGNVMLIYSGDDEA
jgi:hypothetical protein